MKFIFLVSILLFVGACGHKAHDAAHHHEGHDHATMEHKDHAAACEHHKEDKKEHKCSACADKDKSKCAGECKKDGKACGCKHEGKSCGTDGAKGAMCSASESLENNQAILKNISQDEFTKLYAKNKTQIGKTCTTPAMEYCGKTTKDLNVSESELTCLWTKVFRVTRERLPQLDGTPCATMIQKFAKK